MNEMILSEKTLKLKTKVITLSSISLFIGLTKLIPHEFKLIGVELPKDDKTLGWFILLATTVMLVYFIMNVYLEFEKYNLEKIVENKTKNIKSEVSGITQDEYYNKGDMQIEYYNERVMEGMDDSDSFTIQKNTVRHKLVVTHIKFQKIITYIFEFTLPIILAMLGIYYLFTFLMV